MRERANSLYLKRGAFHQVLWRRLMKVAGKKFVIVDISTDTSEFKSRSLVGKAISEKIPVLFLQVAENKTPTAMRTELPSRLLFLVIAWLASTTAALSQETKDYRRLSPMHQAILDGDKGRVEIMLNEHADVNAKNNAGETPLHLAAYKGSIDLVQLLLAHGADIDSKSCEGKTPLFIALASTEPDVAKCLIDKGADVNPSDLSGFTALHWAAAAGQRELVELLLNKGAEINAYDTGGVTPLHVAISQQHLGVVELLLAKGADPNRKTSNGGTPLDLGTRGSHQGILAALRRGGARDGGLMAPLKGKPENGILSISQISEEGPISPVSMAGLPQKYRVVNSTKEGLNLRVDTSIDSQIIAVAYPCDTPLTGVEGPLLGIDGRTWVKVRATGWVPKRFLQATSDGRYLVNGLTLGESTLIRGTRTVLPSVSPSVAEVRKGAYVDRSDDEQNGLLVHVSVTGWAVMQASGGTRYLEQEMSEAVKMVRGPDASASATDHLTAPPKNVRPVSGAKRAPNITDQRLRSKERQVSGAEGRRVSYHQEPLLPGVKEESSKKKSFQR